MTSSPEPFTFDRLSSAATRAAVDRGERERVLVEQAHADGYAEGYAAGRADAEAELRVRIERAAAALAAATAELARARDRAAQALEPRAVELALRIAEKVVAGTVTAEPRRILDVVAGALQRLAERSRVTVVINPDDLATVRAQADAIGARIGGIEQLEVQADSGVGRGGAIVRTSDGEIDATVESKLERVRELLAGDDRQGR